MKDRLTIESEVQAYYGVELKGSEDLKTNACCTPAPDNPAIRQALENVHDEVSARYYGCGLTIPTTVQGLRVLDLGSGSGRDCYLLSQLVGEQGSVLGLDMTDEQLDVARAHLDWHRERFGYAQSNVAFVKGNIMDLAGAGIADESVDLIVSNCVVNLATDKAAVLSEAHRVLREGGEFYFSDVYCDRRLPEDLQNDRELYGECLGGALYWNDFQNLAKAAGFGDPRVVESRRLTVDNPGVEAKVKGYRFYSVTYRLFKLPGLEPACEDYGHEARYLGGIEQQDAAFTLDDHHVFQKDQWKPVCGNTDKMLADTRFAPFFELRGDFSTHLGIFTDCGSGVPFDEGSPQACC
ncbi:MAG: methyltransferase domain-containing protein [Myxococcota bacterium]|nr:methyltransferase domain-containing protein [Myxococcota bacterium]